VKLSGDEARARSVQTGRPTRVHARQRQEQLLEQALDMFARDGFELTTMDAIAASLNMTKRTIYARYKDKADLFEAAVKRAIERWVIPTDVLRSLDTGVLETTLTEIARMRIDNNLSRDGLRLQRIATSEAFRFPEVFRAYEAVTREVLEFLAELFESYLGKGELARSANPRLAASAFLAMINLPVRETLLFNRTPQRAAVEALIEGSVRLLLDGLRPR
jgi:TetR/AcrR family transcriptional regulator, mexJK operon transcriptional repressor